MSIRETIQSIKETIQPIKKRLRPLTNFSSIAGDCQPRTDNSAGKQSTTHSAIHTGRTITYKQDQKICHPFNRQGSRTISRSLRRLFCLRWQDIGFDQGVAGGVPFATHDRGGIPGDNG